MQDEKDPRAELEQLAELLRSLSSSRSLHFSAPTIRLMTGAADAIARYLSGEAGSLDAAFGLTPKRGRPGKPDEHEGIARRIDDMREADMSWLDITDALSKEGCTVTDERTLRRIHLEFWVKLRTEEMNRVWPPDEGDGA